LYSLFFNAKGARSLRKEKSRLTSREAAVYADTQRPFPQGREEAGGEAMFLFAELTITFSFFRYLNDILIKSHCWLLT
jgi:hypothetical protein